MALRKDPSIQLFGCRPESLMPWDPMAKEWPNLVAVPLGLAFLAEWAEEIPVREGTPQGAEAPASAPSDPRVLDLARQEASRTSQELTEDETRWNAVVDRLETAEAAARGREVELRSLQAKVSGSSELISKIERTVELIEGRAVAAGVAAGLASGRLRAPLRRAAAARADRERRGWAERLEAARAQQQRSLAELKEMEADVARARSLVDELRGQEWQIRETLAPKRERAMRAAQRLRELSDPAFGMQRAPFSHITVARRHELLGTLSLGEWAIRATGHGTRARFLLEVGWETLWLMGGEWYAADSDLAADEVMTLVRGEVLDLDPRAATSVWERDGGRCVHCGAMGGLEIERLVPRALGGGDAPSNLRLLCRNCAREKAHNR